MKAIIGYMDGWPIYYLKKKKKAIIGFVNWMVLMNLIDTSYISLPFGYFMRPSCFELKSLLVFKTTMKRIKKWFGILLTHKAKGLKMNYKFHLTILHNTLCPFHMCDIRLLYEQCVFWYGVLYTEQGGQNRIVLLNSNHILTVIIQINDIAYNNNDDCLACHH